MRYIRLVGFLSFVGCYYGPRLLLDKDPSVAEMECAAPEDTDQPHDTGRRIGPEGLVETGQFAEDPPADTYELWF